jgi:hypothetical protein
MTRGQQLYFLSKESHATDFIALKNPLFSAGFEPTNLRYNGKHDSHYTKEDDL